MIAMVGMNKYAGISLPPSLFRAQPKSATIVFGTKPAAGPKIWNGSTKIKPVQTYEQEAAALGKKHGQSIPNGLDLTRAPKAYRNNTAFMSTYDKAKSGARNMTAAKGAVFNAATTLNSKVINTIQRPGFEHWDNAAQGVLTGVRHMVGV